MAICRVYERPDGSLLIVHPDPRGRRPGESEAAWLARVWARLAETSPDWVVLPYVDLDDADLPPRDAPCQDGCGEVHSVRDQWRMQGVGKRRAPAVDRTVRNPNVEARHREQSGAKDVR